MIMATALRHIFLIFLDNLFPESENPSRVFIVIVESDAYLGSYFKSPFTFRRNWLVEGLGSIQNSLQSENTYLKSSLDELKSQMSVLVNFIQNQQTPLNNQRSESNDDSENESLKAKRQKRSKRGKQKKKNNVEESQPSTSLLGRIYNSFQSNDNISLNEGGMSDIQSVSDFNPSAAEEQFGLQGIKTNYYITNIELELMSTPLDQFNSRGTEDDSMVDFVRLQKCINQFNQVLSCGISYDHFLKGAFIAAFDLTTNSQPNLTYAINTVRTGILFSFL